MENTKHIVLIGNNVGLEMARIKQETKTPIVLVGQEKTVEELLISTRGLMKDTALSLHPKLIDLDNYKSGRENRKERRKTERKNKKL